MNGPKLNLNTFNEPKKRRDSSTILPEIEQNIGTSLILYDYLLHICRTLFIKTNNIKFCTFRYEMLMFLHDNKVNQVIYF